MFTHLHLHTQYSLLDGAAGIKPLMAKVKEFGMNAVAITDHGNMFGVPEFIGQAQKQGIKPIIGCEFYLAPKDRTDKKTRAVSDPKKKEKYSYHQILLAKNETGYKNLCKLNTVSFREGFYYRPRIDKSLLAQYHEGLIATTCCLAAEIPSNILYAGEEAAEKILREWIDIFGEDYYIELQRHGIDEQDQVNAVLMKWAKKYNVKTIATNDVHYIKESDWEAQDILLCLKTGRNIDDTDRMRFKGTQFYLKSPQQMVELFKDVPEAIDNTQEITDKVNVLNIKRPVVLPVFEIPQGFTSDKEYLRHLTWLGAKERYNELNEELTKRIEFELGVIENMGFAGYFLIVHDFIQAAKRFGVRVGPARGSAAGSVVAYSMGITGIDPIQYNLLFERFLNPERVTMPDIDIDFDDEKRDQVIQYVLDKYGRDHVAHLVTFNMMGPKLAIRDVARVLKLPLYEADRLAKLVPDGPDVSFERAKREVPEFLEEFKNTRNPLISRTLQLAETIEGSPRHTGIHAAGIIIAPDKLENYIPLTTIENASLPATQFDGKHIESVGMLKMDFLGLRTLSIINDTLRYISERHGVTIDVDKIPIDDTITYELFQRGDTIGIFQFESPGMRTYLKELKPTNIEDLIAMNALYRPGAMSDIPSYISRKNGREKITYPSPLVEPVLKPTFGVIVYQEQVMTIVQQVGGFTKGQADSLRKAMSKKDPDTIATKRQQFITGALQTGMEEKNGGDLYDRMAKFGGYGFNRSHSAGYALLAYQTGYLKANYPAEFMAAVLTREMGDIKKVNFYMEECKRQKINVLGPDINESDYLFTINKNNEIRFALAALKNVGEGAVQLLVEERNKNGFFKNIYDFVARVNLQKVNKRALESLAMAGAFDAFKLYRSQYFHKENEDGLTFTEQLIRCGSGYKDKMQSSRHSLFGEGSHFDISWPKPPTCAEWDKKEKLMNEKAVTGIYLSGHPLDDYRLEIDSFCTATISQVNTEIEKLKHKDVTITGIVNEVKHRTARTGNPFGVFTLEDFTDSMEITLFSEDYLKMKHFLVPGQFLYIKGRVIPRLNSARTLDFRVNQMMLLTEVKEKITRNFLIKVNLADISENLINGLNRIMVSNPGKTEVQIIVTDNGVQPLQANSRKHKVKVTSAFINEISRIGSIEIKLS